MASPADRGRANGQPPLAAAYGGPWSGRKLAAVTKYCSAFTTIMRQRHFTYGYIDAFAGSGYRDAAPNAAAMPSSGLFGAEAVEIKRFVAGSPIYAMRCSPAFQRFVFIEAHKPSLDALQRTLEAEFPDLVKHATFDGRDANVAVQEICAKNWRTHRAVMFLDPYATQVRWETIEAIGKTKAVDLWILFPLGAVNRMLMRNGGKIPESWAKVLTRQLGTDTWCREFYRPTPRGFWGDTNESYKVATPERIVQFYLEQLRTVFEHVPDRALLLLNRKKSPIFALCFASANKVGAKIARDVMLKG
jgi:three-Cys-motif partner protein